MKPYMTRKLAEGAGAMLILLPSVLLMAWGAAIPAVRFCWSVLTVCSGIFLFALYSVRRRSGVSTKKFISECGGYCIMFLFVFFQCVTQFLYR